MDTWNSSIESDYSISLLNDSDWFEHIVWHRFGQLNLSPTCRCVIDYWLDNMTNQLPSSPQACINRERWDMHVRLHYFLLP
jgi:hypothetical protein